MSFFENETPKKSAFEKGYDIGRLNKVGAINDYAKETLNPYPPDSKEFDGWNRGFDSAVGGW